MKKLLVLIFSILISFNSYGEWMKVTESVDGDGFYIDIDTIKEHDGRVYYWRLRDFLKPSEGGMLSGATYIEGDCKISRIKSLSYSVHYQSMGRGEGEQSLPIGNNGDWRYPSPDDVEKTILDFVCDYFK